jgi:Zn-dependent protease with chaperone function
MYANVITFLAVILLFELLPPSGMGVRLTWGEILAGTGCTILLFAVLVRWGFLRWDRRGGAGLLDPDGSPFFRAALVQRYVAAAVALYGVILYLLRWKTLCIWVFGEEGSGFLTSLLGILPFLLLLVSVWISSYPARLGQGGRGHSLQAYVSAQGKLYLPTVLPWFALLLLMDLLALLAPQLQRRVEEDVLWGLGTFAAVLVVLAWAFPRLVVGLWRCPPMEAGPRRNRLEKFFERHGFRSRGIVLWNLFEGSFSTAGILGVFPGSRYILVTPALLDALNDDELEAVMAHEMGHARHRHMVFYLAFMVGLTLLVDLAFRGVPWLITLGLMGLEKAGVSAAAWLAALEVQSTHVSLAFTLLFVLLVIAYFRYGFGVFSRNFERQSDLHALEIQGTARHVAQSLEKIAGHHPRLRMLPNWHHFGIQERIDFLLRCERFPEEAQKHHRKVRRMVRSYLVGLAILGAVLVGWRTQHWDRAWTLALQERMVEQLLTTQPESGSLWLALGTISLERGNPAKAESALDRAIRLEPTNGDALNNLAWLYATSADPRFRDPQRALHLARTAVQLMPHAAHALDTLAEALFVNDQIAEALETERRALELARDRLDHYRRQIRRFQEALSTPP